MLPKNDESNTGCSSCSANTLISKITGFNNWVYYGPRFKDILTELLLVYIRSDIIDGAPQSKREDVSYTVSMLNMLLDDLAEYEDLQDEAAA